MWRERFLNKRWSYIFLGLGFLFFIYWVQFVFRHPVSYDIGEGFLLDRAIALASGRSVYPSLVSPPYLVTPYTPVVIIILAGLSKVFGQHLWPGRLFTIFCLLGSVSAAAYMIKDKGGGLKKSLIYMLLLLCSYHVISMATIFTVQWPAIFISLLGLAFFQKRPYVGIFIMSFGLMAKQSQMLAPSAALMWMLFKDWKQALRLGGFFLFCVFAELWIFSQMFGEMFLTHILKYTVGTYGPGNFSRLAAYGLTPYFILVILAGVFAFRMIREKKSDLLLFYLFVTSLGLFASLRLGSDVKYFLEFYVALFMFVVASIHRSEKKLKAAFIIQLVLLCLFTTYMLQWNSKRVYEKDLAARELVPVLKKIRGNIISEDSSLVVMSGKGIFMESFPMSELAKRGLWDQAPFLESLRNGEVSAVVLQFALTDENPYFTAKDRFTPQMRDVIKKNFFLDRKTGPFYLYLPKNTKQ